MLGYIVYYVYENDKELHLVRSYGFVLDSNSLNLMGTNTMADIDSKHATKDAYGNVTAKDQGGIDAKGKPKKKAWQFGDSLKDVKPTKTS